MNPDMADVGEEFKKKENKEVKIRARKSHFKMPKKMRKEWGERMAFLRSIK